MKVDLSKLKAGDTVEVVLDERDVDNLQDEEEKAAFWNVSQIAKHTPKPFDWDTVEPGDPFKSSPTNATIVKYVGPCLSDSDFAVVEHPDGGYSDYLKERMVKV